MKQLQSIFRFRAAQGIALLSAGLALIIRLAMANNTATGMVSPQAEQALRLAHLCGQTGQGSLCDSALSIASRLAQQGDSTSYFIVRGVALYNRFLISEEAALAPALKVIGEDRFTNVRGYQFIGQASTADLRGKAQEAVAVLSHFPQDNDGSYMRHELQDRLEDMNGH